MKAKSGALADSGMTAHPISPTLEPMSAALREVSPPEIVRRLFPGPHGIVQLRCVPTGHSAGPRGLIDDSSQLNRSGPALSSWTRRLRNNLEYGKTTLLHHPAEPSGQ